MSSCKSCKARVVFVRTTTGASMICDPEVVVFAVGGGHETMITNSGNTYAKCRTGRLVTSADVGHRLRGRRPHWGSCPTPTPRKRPPERLG